MGVVPPQSQQPKVWASRFSKYLKTSIESAWETREDMELTSSMKKRNYCYGNTCRKGEHKTHLESSVRKHLKKDQWYSEQYTVRNHACYDQTPVTYFIDSA